MRLLSRRLLNFIGSFALGSLLFTQAALAAQACRLPILAPAVAIAAGSEASPCGDSRNHCFTHCIQSYQASDFVKPLVIPPSWPATAAVQIVVETTVTLPYLQPSLLARDTDVPVCVRQCRLLN